MSLTILDYLAHSQCWEPTYTSSSSIVGYCPLHYETKPSFTIYPRDWHFHCYSCHENGDLVGLICLVEFGSRTKEHLGQAFERVKALNGGTLPGEINRGRSFDSSQYIRQERPFATEDQQVMLTALAEWWHIQLLKRNDESKKVREYLLSRGIPREIPAAIGYAPPSTDTRAFIDLSHFLSRRIGIHWQELGKSTGLLRRDGSLRLYDRILFSCYNGELVQFHQGRKTPWSTEEGRKFLMPPELHKVPFSLPITSPSISGIILCESPFGPSVCLPYNIPVVATLGEGIDPSTLRWFPRPFYLCTDNDAPRTDTWGKPYQPGDRQAEHLMVMCHREGWENYRVSPPREQKGLDEWVHAEGPDPLLATIGSCLALSTPA